MVNTIEAKTMERGIDIVGQIIQKETTRRVKTKHGWTSVANASLQDEFGSIKIVLWASDADEIKNGHLISIKNAYWEHWNKEPQISAGFYGKITILQKTSDESYERAYQGWREHWSSKQTRSDDKSTYSGEYEFLNFRKRDDYVHETAQSQCFKYRTTDEEFDDLANEFYCAGWIGGRPSQEFLKHKRILESFFDSEFAERLKEINEQKRQEEQKQEETGYQHEEGEQGDSKDYATLEISQSATNEEIKSAYRKLAMKWHPDKNPPEKKKMAAKKFIQIQKAYDNLTKKPKS